MPQLTWAAPASLIWIDVQGQVHNAKQLGDVPEPYRSAYATRADESEASGGADEDGTAYRGGGTNKQVAAGRRDSGRAATLSPMATQQAERRTWWQQQVRAARRELLAATYALAQLEDRVATAAANPILRLTPAVRVEVDQLGRGRERAQARVAAARQALMQTLPEQARRERAPTQWLD